MNRERGYIGISRSVRSQKAINSYEIPISMITRNLIDEFLGYEIFTDDEISKLEKISVAKWKYVAKERVNPSSWHHTSKFYNITYHYDLKTLSDKLLSMKNLDEEYKAYLKSKKPCTKNKKQIKKKEKVVSDELKRLFRYQSKFTNLSDFIESDINLEELSAIRAEKIAIKREELKIQWEKQLPKDNWRWESLNDDKFIEGYL